MDKRRNMDSEEYQGYLADIRNKKRERIMRALRKKKDIVDKSSRKLNSLRGQYSKIPAVISKIHFDGLCRTQDDMLLLPEVKKMFARVSNFEELVATTNQVMAQLYDMGCFDEVFAEIDTDDSAHERYEVTFKAEEYGLFSFTPSLSNITPLTNQSLRINPVISARLLNLFGRAESLEAEMGTTTCSTDANTFFRRIMFSKPLVNHSNLSFLGEHLHYPVGNPFEQICDEKNVKVTAFWFPKNWLQHSLSVGASVRYLSCKGLNSPFSTREECGHSLKASLSHDLLVDTTNDDLIPTSGLYVNLKQEFAGVLGNVRFIKNSLQVSLFVPLLQSLSLGIGISAGGLFTPFTGGPLLPENKVTSVDRFGVGGPLTTRGFHHRGLGSCLGASSFWAASSKLIASLPFIRQNWVHENIKAHIFLDVADDSSVMGLFGRDSKELRASAGGGLAFKIGTLGRGELNYVIPIRTKTQDSVSHGVQFGLGIDFI